MILSQRKDGKMDVNQITVIDPSLPTKISSSALLGSLLVAAPQTLVRSGKITSADLPVLKVLSADLRETLTPVAPEEIVAALVRLFAHYPAQPISSEQAELRWEDWAADFADVPADLFETACTRWRRSKDRYAPTPGQLLDKIAERLTHRRMMIDRVSRTIHLLEGD